MIRLHPGSEEHSHGAVLHRVVRATNNLPIREVITGTKTVSTHRPSSWRYGGSFAVEGFTAKLLAEHDEVVTDVVDSAPEFLRFEGVVDGRLTVTIPDRCRVQRSGRVQVIECKHNWAAFSKPRARRQSLLTQASCDALGWEYVRMVPESIGSRQFRRNIHQIQLCRHVAVSPAQEAAALACTEHGPTTLAEISALLERAIGRHRDDAYPVGRATAYALMVRRVISIDLNGGLDPNTRVERAPLIPIGLPSFRSSRFL